VAQLDDLFILKVPAKRADPSCGYLRLTFVAFATDLQPDACMSLICVNEPEPCTSTRIRHNESVSFVASRPLQPCAGGRAMGYRSTLTNSSIRLLLSESVPPVENGFLVSIG
jgi:hypothetical protein